MPTYDVTGASLQIPRLDDDGKLSKTSNVLAVGGKTVTVSEAMAAPFVESGHLKLRPEREQQELEEGSEVNGPGADALTGFPTPQTTENSEGSVDPGDQGPKRPGKNATLEDLRAFATVQEIEFTDKDTKADLQRKIDEKLNAE